MKNIIIILLLLTSIITLKAQQVDLENLGDVLKKKPLKITGGITANNVFYGGNEHYNHDFWNYFLSGSINFSFYEQFNLPFSFNITNSGANMTYPTLPNRFSFHPTYKWISGHIGDVSMSFSPYTLNGHQFTGAGVDLTPTGNWKISAMAGQLQRSVAYDTLNPYSLPYYQRMGYGTKVRYETEKYKIGIIGFYANDNASSIAPPPDSLNIVPQKNIVLSGDIWIQLFTNLNLAVEYAHSILTDKAHELTQDFNALKASFNWLFLKNSLGITYEYVAPDYTTLGAYYFNNDFQNITLNYARPLFNDKLNVAINLGIQQDDLSNRNNTATNRYVGSVNLSYAPTERINAHASYSNFQSHTNIKSPFDYINQTHPAENLDTLNFSQLSQTAGLMVNFSFGKSTKDAIKHQLSLNFNFQEAVNKRGDIAYIGDITRFYTFATTYGLQFPKGIQLISIFNLSYNDMGISNQLTLGPSIGINGQFLEKTLSAGILTSYNTGFTDGNAQNSIANIRGNIGYKPWQHHQFMANCIYQLRSYTGKDNTHGITATIGYAYNF